MVEPGSKSRVFWVGFLAHVCPTAKHHAAFQQFWSLTQAEGEGQGIFFTLFFTGFTFLLLEGGEGREKEGERDIGQSPLPRTPTRTWRAPRAHGPPGIAPETFRSAELTTEPPSHTSQDPHTFLEAGTTYQNFPVITVPAHWKTTTSAERWRVQSYIE